MSTYDVDVFRNKINIFEQLVFEILYFIISQHYLLKYLRQQLTYFET